MQEPDILPLFQTMPKAESPLSFFGDEVLAGPIRVIIGTTQRQDVMISGGLYRENERLIYTIAVEY